MTVMKIVKAPLKILLLATTAVVLVACNGGKDGIQFGSPEVEVKGLTQSNSKAEEYEYAPLTLEVQLGQHEDAVLEFDEDAKQPFERKVQDRKKYTISLKTGTELCGFVVAGEGEESGELADTVESKNARASFLIECIEPEAPEEPEEEGDDDDDGGDDGDGEEG